MSSNHFQVAERSLFLLNNEHLMKMISENKETLFPILIKGLLKNSKHHWNQYDETISLLCRFKDRARAYIQCTEAADGDGQ